MMDQEKQISLEKEMELNLQGAWLTTGANFLWDGRGSSDRCKWVKN